MTDNPEQKKVSDPKEMYPRLRSMMLKGTRPRSIPEPEAPTEPWGVLMDWGVQNGSATVMSMADGSASVYFISGGGFIGGKEIMRVREAAQRVVQEARAVQLPEKPTISFPLPETHGMIFYFLSDAGVYMRSTSQHELNSASHPLKKLGDAMQSVITQFRIWQAETKSKAKQEPN